MIDERAHWLLFYVRVLPIKPVHPPDAGASGIEYGVLTETFNMQVLPGRATRPRLLPPVRRRIEYYVVLRRPSSN
jgi:hypothetical protein